ncbi:hypothetical protein [Terrabacter sp. Ter38]|uniref:hypothetical protein n=1 Tax=Terrabacter sp. Ter38 TaxID=2926030 RepID=UPI002118DA25|nr:hypothetical protein [Terrabacter sp. Ter38]
MPSRLLARALPFVGGALALCLGTAACTTDQPRPQGSPTGPWVGTAPGVQLGDPAVGTPAPGGDMTAVPEDSSCAAGTERGAGLPVRPADLWPGASATGGRATEVRARPGVPCPAEPAPEPDCGLPVFAWSSSTNEELLGWTGAERVLSGFAGARVAASSDAGTGSLSVGYVSLRFREDDSRLAVTRAHVEDAMRRCGGGRPGTLGGVSGFVASQESLVGADPVRTLLVAGPDRLVWVALDGGAWSATSTERAVHLTLQRLRTS